MRVRLSIPLALLAIGAGAASAWSQDAGARAGVRGVVRSGSGELIAYAVVALAPGYGQRFTDDAGAFAFGNVPPGTYHLLVRQVGFKPFDTTVVKVSNNAVALTVTLDHLAVELAEITVVSERRCSVPGPPDAALMPELAAVFDQLRQNAERYALLADSYPFRYRLARSMVDYDDAEKVLWSGTDTVEYHSNARAHYQPGDVVGLGTGPAGKTARVLKLPTLSDLADSAFLANHCFAFRGTLGRDGERLVRFEFRPAEALQSPDIEGDVDLDARSYQVRHASIRLTHPGRAMAGLLSTSSTMTFTELYPNIVLPSRVEGSLVPVPDPGVRRRTARFTETQQLIDVRFLRSLPGRPAGP
jgi:hypothetical protein